MKGTIKMFDSKKHYGFIIPFDNPNGEDIFFHESQVFGEALFKKGDLVQFNIVDGQKGRCAINVIRGVGKK